MIKYLIPTLLLFQHIQTPKGPGRFYGPTNGELLAHERCLMWYVELHDDTPINQACPVPGPVFVLDSWLRNN